LNGVAAGVALGHLAASWVGELNQKPTLKVWMGVNAELGFSMNVSLSKIPRTVTEALPELSLCRSDWYQPNPKLVNPASKGEF
jgi:hypothetical protein